MAEEINANNLSGAQTLVNIGQRAPEVGLDIKRDDIRFVLEVVSEADPWFEQGASSISSPAASAISSLRAAAVRG